ncbi:ubiquitin family protein [Mycena haematopus]|nr:ubiquitin family protein [Mycena haematopus]
MSIPHLLNPLQLPGSHPQRRRGKKPIIYLFSPTVIEATVKLSLVPTWSFSSVYPIVPVETSESGGDVVQWNVRTHMDGNLTELGTGLEISYLFWEADVILEQEVNKNSQTEHLIPADNSNSEQFNPASCNLSDENAVLLPSSNAASYLNSMLEILGLHTEARTSFITFWLPFLLRHKHIALRFLPQSMYSHAAPLSVDPKPDVVTRIFMLFTGVTDEDRLEWSLADLRANEDGAWWKDVVGIEEMRMKDEGLFRVLEWGGMEIY